MTIIFAAIKNKRRGAVGLLAAAAMSAAALIMSTGLTLNAGYTKTLMNGAARTSGILRGSEYEQDGIQGRPFAGEERDLWLAFIGRNAVALKDILIFKENIQKMYTSSKRYIDALNSQYKISSVSRNYGWNPYYRDYIIRFDSKNGLAVTFPDFDKIPDTTVKSSTGDEADELNIFILNNRGNNDLYGADNTVNDIELDKMFSVSKTFLNNSQNSQ